MTRTTPTSAHTTVLLSEAVEMLEIVPGDTVVDATLGGAGHFAKLLGALGADGVLVGIDADPDAVSRARDVVAHDTRAKRPTVHIIEDNFKNLGHIVERVGALPLNRALFDLGWSGYHLTSGRGFSFQSDEPLYMTYGRPESAERTAADIVNSMPEDELADLIYTLGDETFSRQIAKSIALHRRKERILTTNQLVAAIVAGVPASKQHGRINPATKTFQALRIAVNDELSAAQSGITAALSLLAPGGRVAVITFHSIEDRLVKSLFRDAAEQGAGTLVTKKPVAPSDMELAENPRARSAKLRVFEKAAAPYRAASSLSVLSHDHAF